jgi:mono/diheme cytochrome c family protein
VATSWVSAESSAVVAPSLRDGLLPDDERREAIERGKEIFLSELTACSKCHGKEGDGKGLSQDFDDWTKDWTIRAGIDPTKKEDWKPMKRFGALKPVIDHSRNLTLGAFRGGSSREDIYLRIVLGIEGSPMPAIARKENDNPGVNERGIQDLIEYVVSLSEVHHGK